jgi:hypothetical protein
MWLVPDRRIERTIEPDSGLAPPGGSAAAGS